MRYKLNATWQSPSQIGTTRIWQNISNLYIYFKEGANPSNDTDGQVLNRQLLTGAASPVGATTPVFIGQIYVQTNTTPDTIWQAVGLTNTDWVVVNTRGALAAYTADVENVAYTGNPASLADAAANAELNALRVAYENLRAAVEDIRSKIV